MLLMLLSVLLLMLLLLLLLPLSADLWTARETVRVERGETWPWFGVATSACPGAESSKLENDKRTRGQEMTI